jgi:hypothetical protein
MIMEKWVEYLAGVTEVFGVNVMNSSDAGMSNVRKKIILPAFYVLSILFIFLIYLTVR